MSILHPFRLFLFIAIFFMSAEAFAAGYTSALTFNGNPAPSLSKTKGVIVDSSLNTWGVGDFINGTMKFKTTTISSSKPAIFVFKQTPSGNYPVVLSFETNLISDTVAATGITVDSNGVVSIYGNFRGSLHVGGTTLTSGSGVNSAFLIQLSSSGTILNAISSSNSGNVGSGKIIVDGSDNIYLTGTYSGSFSLGSVSLPNASSNEGFIIKVSSSGSVLNGQVTAGTGSHSTVIWSASLNPSDNSIFVTGRFLNNAKFGTTNLASSASNTFVAKLDSSLNWLGAVAPTFTGATSNASNSEGYDIQVNGNSVIVTGRFQTESGVTINFGPSTLTSLGFDSYVAVTSTSTPLAFSSANQIYTSDGKGVALALSSVTGNVWNAGVLRTSGNFSGTIINSPGYNAYLATVSSASVFGSATASTNTNGGAVVHSIAIGSNGLVVIAGEFSGTVKFGAKKISASNTSAFVAVYTP